jgi:hypothetical protein
MTYYSCTSRYKSAILPLREVRKECQEKVHTISSFPTLNAVNWNHWPENIRHRIETSSAPKSSSMRPRACPTTSLLHASIPHDRLSANGVNVSTNRGSLASKNSLEVAPRRAFPPSIIVEVKALACELPKLASKPLSRFSMSEIRRAVIERGLVAEISGTTVWRWLDRDAIRPWRYRSWIFPRDPKFTQKAARILDLYEGRWAHKPLGAKDFVVSADEKTSIQARSRCHPSTPPTAGRPLRVEHEYERRGALAYLAAWDVHRAKVFGRCETTTGITPFDRLVKDVMSQEPYRSARRVFWIVDNGSSHRGLAAANRLKKAWPTIILVHTPVHASWLNQIEIYFSIIQRKVLTPNDFSSVTEIEQRLLCFQDHYEQVAKPFQWTFTRRHLLKLFAKLSAHENRGLAA